MKKLKSIFLLLLAGVVSAASAQTTYKLSQFDGSLNPDAKTEWVIEIGSGQGGIPTSAFAGLKKAITAATSPVSIKIVGDKAIPHGAFQGCLNLADVDASQSREIMGGAFMKSSITGITLSNNIKCVQDNAFRDCRELKYVKFSAEPRTESEGMAIGTSAFMDCRQLKEVKMPLASSVQSYAFNGCTELLSVDISGATAFGNILFGSCNKIQRIDMSAAGKFEFIAQNDKTGNVLFHNIHLPQLAKNTTLVLCSDKAEKKGSPKVDMETKTWMKNKAGEPVVWANIELVEREVASKKKKKK